MNLTRENHPPARQTGWSLIEVLAAIVVVGIGVALFTKVQKMTSSDSSTNSRILMAGRMIEKHLEDTRILIGNDTVANWPPKNLTLSAKAPDFIALKREVSLAYSPKHDGVEVINVRKLVLTASWTRPKKDSLKVTTYVAKRF